MSRCARFLTFMALLLLDGAVADAARKPRPAPCPPGVFVLDAATAARLTAAIGEPIARLEVAGDGTVRIGSCVTTVRTKAKRAVTRLTATWKRCGGARTLRLAGAQPSPACTSLGGTVRAKKVKRMRFTAPRLEPTTTTTTLVSGTTTSTTLAPGTTTTTVSVPTTSFTFPTFSTTTSVTTTTSTSSTLPLPAPACGNGIVDAGEQCEGVAGCGAGTACNSACACAPDAVPTTDQSLIAAALAAGAIDYPTSLLYRTFALFADGRLPEQYDGEAWIGSDATLFAEIGNVWDALPEETQDLLAPFLRRPDELGSYYDAGPSAPGFAAAAGSGVECGYKPGADRPDWRFTETEHFVIWSCGHGDLEGDVDAARRSVAGAVAEEVWAAMVPETGAPKADDYAAGPAPTTRTDVYLVTPQLCKRREGSCAPIPVDDGVAALAAAAPAPPCGPGAGGALTTSGYMILDRTAVPETLPGGPLRMRYVFAHEFFHLIENSLNFEAQGGTCGAGRPAEAAASWLVEASAEWAAWAYFPADGEQDRPLLYGSGFQRRPSGTSLRSLAGIHPYEAFIYPFFVQQETSRTAFVDFWKNSGAARTAQQLDDRLDVTLEFRERFRDFTVRNFNATAATLPGDPLPLAARHQQQDPLLPADVRPRVLEPSVTLADAPAQIARAASIGPLSAQYEHYVVGEATHWVRIDVQTLANSAFVQLDALVNVDGVWQRRRIDGPVFEFCRDDPDDDISELYLVITHRDRRPNVSAVGTYDVKTRPLCPSGWSGTIRMLIDIEEHSYEAGPSGIEIEDDRAIEEHQWTVVSTAPAGDPPPPDYDVVELAWSGRWEKNRTWQRLNSGGCLGQPIHSRTTGFGVGAGTDRMEMVSFQPTIYLPQIDDAWLTNLIEGTTTYHTEICTGQTVGSSEALENLLDELPAALSVPGLLQMTPNDPLDPHHYFGEAILVDETDPDPHGYSRFHWRVDWDLRRR